MQYSNPSMNKLRHSVNKADYTMFWHIPANVSDIYLTIFETHDKFVSYGWA